MATVRRLSILEVAQAAWQGGFRDAESLITAVAIAMRESGGNPAARCVDCIPRPGGGFYNDDSHGLWQINIRAHPSYDPTLLETDPVYAARAAFAVSGQGSTWRPWRTPSGNYLTGTNVPLVRRILDPVLARPNAATVLGAPIPGAMPDLTRPPASSSPGGAVVVPAGAGGLDLLLPGYGAAKTIFGKVFGGALDDTRKAVLGSVANLVITGVIVTGGVALAVAGFYRAAVGSKTGQAVKNTAQTAAGAAIAGPAGAAAGAA